MTRGEYVRPVRAALERLRRDPGLACLVLALLGAVALYAPAIGRGLVNYDDPWLYSDNHIVQHASWESVRRIFFDTRPATRFILGAEYLPVRDLSVMLDYQLWGSWYGGFHLTNLVIYLAAIALWFGAFASFGVDRRVCGVMALVWALHPSHAESVAWLAERKGLLGAMFAGAAALAYARFRGGATWRWLLLGAAAAVAAVWSKAPSAFALAALAPLEAVLPGRASWRRSLVGLAAIGAPALAAFAPVVMIARSSDVVSSSDAAPAGPLAMGLGLHGFYLRLAAMLVRDAASYPIHTLGPSGAEVALGAVTLAVVLAAAAVPWRQPPVIRAAAALWLVTWLPASRWVLPLRAVLVADRYLLLPTLGIALAIGAGVIALRDTRLRIAALVAVVALAGLRAWDAQTAWGDDVALWERALASNPDDGDVWATYAELLFERGTPDLAEDAVARGLARARTPRLVLRAGLILLARGERAEGVQMIREAAQAGEPRAKANLALLLFDDRKLDEALAWARQAASEAPLYVNAQRAHGKVALELKHFDEALAAFERAYALEPGALANRYNLGVTLVALGRGAEARPHLEACLADPQLAPGARAALEHAP
jgi:protein O-mannosyl-transferase